MDSGHWPGDVVEDRGRVRPQSQKCQMQMMMRVQKETVLVKKIISMSANSTGGKDFEGGNCLT